MTTMHTPPIFEITRENLVHLVWMEDEIVHDATRPFCNQPDCPCHEDADLVREYITRPLDNGLITDAEAIRIYWAGNVVVGTIATDVTPPVEVIEDEEIEAIMGGHDPEDDEDEEENGRYRRHWLSEHL